ESTFLRYTFEGVDKIAAWLPLSNGMRLNITVPVIETEGNWQNLIVNIMIVALEVLAAASLFTMFYSKRITKPLEQLTEAAEQVDKGNYDVALNYDRNDEVGRLTKTFKNLSSHMKANISDLSKRVYVDALTSVRNKGAYSTYLEEMQNRLEAAGGQMAFAVGVFDCDDLKAVNDKFGHDKGDLYLKNASRLICRVFQHSPVFRIGGDEFSVILQNDDFRNRDALVRQFEKGMEEINLSTGNQWEQVRVAMGIAVYDPRGDHFVIDVVRRADKTMYENKRVRKAARKA
ncbi:MAG: diguanylate cyclase, partial [Clostridia bacterium]|nr:diguanylate cyclase [Clostridia bacterium]